MARTYGWDFPLPRTHTGVLQANGTFGVMVWGGGRTLKIALGRVDLWDHRGGMPWTEQQSYANIRACLEKNDEVSLRRLFEETATAPGQPRRPSVLPIGRIDLELPRGTTLQRATLNIDTAIIAVQVRRSGKAFSLGLHLDMKNPLLAVALPAGLGTCAVRCVPAWDFVGAELAALSFEPPQRFETANTAGWTQMRPADPTLGVGYRQTGRVLWVATAYGKTAKQAQGAVRRLLERGADKGVQVLQRSNRAWWSAYWRDVPQVDVPNQHLHALYEYGMYKFAGLTSPDGVAATLQGAWVEEYQLPPWSNDYHFNINVQMCYWPAFHGNRLDHLRPLFDSIDTWMPILKHNARVFLGLEDGIMLPHAVDDRCTCMGGFWTGSIDHGCTAWVGQMMYRYYRYTMDRAFLERTAYPFMVGAMRVYEAMLEEEGGQLTLPISVSPEYRGARMDAWGRNASFQLACIHRLCRDLLDAAQVLGKRPRPIWRRILKDLPQACLLGAPGQQQIALWEGTVLEESHRHHSHLAGITPFDIFDLDDPHWRGVIERSLHHWIKIGPGLWSGWCVPWASMIHTRVGNADAAELWLEIWERLFTNQGRGTLHDVDFSGFSLMGKGAMAAPPARREVMQIEAGMSCVAAIQEMLLHVRDGVNHLFGGAPASWRTTGFANMRTDGAFLLSARRRGGKVGPVQVRSLAGGRFKLANPWRGAAIVVRSNASKERLGGAVLEVEMKKGEELRINAA